MKFQSWQIYNEGQFGDSWEHLNAGQVLDDVKEQFWKILLGEMMLLWP